MFGQNSGGHAPALGSDTFWELDAGAGWHFFQRRATLRLAVLNLLDQDYRLNPLNLRPCLYRHRTLDLSLYVEF